MTEVIKARGLCRRRSFAGVWAGAYGLARDWNVKHDGVGFATRFEVETEFLRRYPVQQAGGRFSSCGCRAEELDEFNTHIVGTIQVVHEFR